MVRDQSAEYVPRCNLSNLHCRMISRQQERRKSEQKMPKCDLIRTSMRLVLQIFDEREVLSTLGPGESPRCSEFASMPIVEVERALALVWMLRSTSEAVNSDNSHLIFIPPLLLSVCSRWDVVIIY